MNKLILVSGGTKGIGLAVLKRFAEAGFDIATCSRNKDDLIDFKNNLSADYPAIRVHAFLADLSDREQIAKLIKQVKSLQQPLDVLVNNAGLYAPGQVHNEEEGNLEFMINTNLYSAYHLTRGFVEEMKERKGGHIFNLCSTASIVPYVNGGSYCISKFALLGMTKVLRQELKNYGIRVTAVMPGATLTNSWAGTELPEERFMKAEDVAEMIFGAYSLSHRSVVEEILMRPILGDI